jgi:hypothetical protein
MDLSRIKEILSERKYQFDEDSEEIDDVIYEVYNGKGEDDFVEFGYITGTKEIIEIFVEKILRLGVGISIDNICCTSIETMGIKNGDDMRAHILNNILGSDLALLMISPSYLQSPICLNEMGAVWSTSIPDVNIFVFPDGELPKSIGWLYEVKQADLLLSKVALDKFYDKVTVMYNLERNVAEWGRQRDGFLLAYNKMKTGVEWNS